MAVFRENKAMKYHHIALSVKDLEASAAFYKEVFGFAEIKRFARKDLELEIALMKLKNQDDLRLELMQSGNPRKNKDDFSDLNILGIKHLCFEVENADEKHQELKAKGYKTTEIKAGESVKKYFFVKDPSGFAVEICENL